MNEDQGSKAALPDVQLQDEAIAVEKLLLGMIKAMAAESGIVIPPPGGAQS